MKILLPVDGSEYTQRMLDYVAAHGELFGPQHDYEIFTVVVAVPSRAAHFLDRATVDGYYRDQAEQVLGPARAFAAKHGWKANLSHGVGHPPDVIAQHAQALGADLIVMGAHGHTAFGNVILGSVTNAVLARCKVPVLLIR
jgi:nucleotide-binding universal stress UspA family protein